MRRCVVSRRPVGRPLRWRARSNAPVAGVRQLAAVALLALLAPLGLPVRARAQQPSDTAGLGREMALLHEAGEDENAGRLADAEKVYDQILKERPGSLSALLSLDRLLRIEGRMQDMIPIVKRHLKAVPDSPIGHQMLLRLYTDLNRPASFDSAAAAWIRAVPKQATPYREIARLLEAQGKDARALKVLEQGRARMKNNDALSLDIGAAYAAVGRTRDAVRAWSHSIGDTGNGLSFVQRRLTELRDGGANVLPGLVDALANPPTTPGRLTAAAELAVQAGLGARALDIAQSVEPKLAPRKRAPFLARVARRAEAAQLPRVAYWAYGVLLHTPGAHLDSLAVRGRMAELALMLGDTAEARASLEAVGASAPPGSLAKRRAAVQAVRLAMREHDLGSARQLLGRFRHDFTNAAESDALAGDLATALLQRGDTAAAGEVLAGTRGPRSSLARGRLALEEGDVATARAALMAAAPGLDGGEATEAIVLARLLGRLRAPAAKRVGRALRLRDMGRPQAAVVLLASSAPTLPEAQQAALLGFAANLADQAGLGAEAMQLRRTLIKAHPDALETPPAMLALARSLASRPGGASEAKKLLQSLIVDHPRSALVPQARQALQRLEGRAPGP